MKKWGIIFWIVQVLIIALSWNHLPLQLPLFYSQPWGEEQLTTPVGILILPVLSLAVFGGNFALINLVPKEEGLLNKILMTASAIFNFLALVTLIKIVLLVS